MVFSFLFLFLFSIRLPAQEKYEVLQDWLWFKSSSNALYDHMAGQAFHLLQQRKDRVNAIGSPAEWQHRQEEVKKILFDIVGPFPQKTPLNPAIIQRVKKEDYSIENIVFESQPGFYVTASLYIPGGFKKKAPAIIYCSGHTNEGYRGTVYQHVILNLVKKGFVVFAFDPVGQGERLQYWDATAGKSTVGGPTHEHSYPGVQAFISGSSLAKYMIWDGIRAVDYLLTRKEVDPNRIGITGRSGGGTQSAYIAAFDDRIYAAAPENYITSFTRLLQSIGPQDAEQNMFHEIARGLDHGDLLEVRAPKPTLMITTTRDMFSIQGARETAREVSRIFKAYNKPENFRQIEDDATHSTTQKNREAMYAFFQKYLDHPGDSTDLEVQLPSAEELRVTAGGQVAASIGGETVFSLNKKETEKNINRLYERRKNSPDFLPDALRSAKTLSGFKEPGEDREAVFAGRFQKTGYAIEKYFIRGEGEYVIPYLLVVPEKANGKIVLVLNPDGKSAEINNGDIKTFMEKGFTVLATDMPGVGELSNDSYKGDSFISNTSYGVWYLSVLTGRSIAGIRAGDVIRLVNWLEKDRGVQEVWGLARGPMTSVMLYAAAFDQRIKKIGLITPLASYRSLVMNRSYDPGFVFSGVAGALQSYDLPDLAAGIAPRKLMIIDAVDGRNSPVDAEAVRADVNFLQSVYHRRGADQNLQLVEKAAGENLSRYLLEWLR
ncbi:MAG: acetylxylan esterase [Chitinophagaceae bacterium]|nr:acetylxylan esterase [Chitinophagaceae bacterium]